MEGQELLTWAPSNGPIKAPGNGPGCKKPKGVRPGINFLFSSYAHEFTPVARQLTEWQDSCKALPFWRTILENDCNLFHLETYDKNNPFRAVPLPLSSKGLPKMPYALFCVCRFGSCCTCPLGTQTTGNNRNSSFQLLWQIMHVANEVSAIDCLMNLINDSMITQSKWRCLHTSTLEFLVQIRFLTIPS